MKQPPDTQEPEERLVAAARADAEAFGPLYQMYIAPVYRYIARYTASIQDAQDLTSATFSKAIASLGRYHEQGTFAAWLFSIARHTLQDYRRRYKPSTDVSLLAQTLAEQSPLPDTQVIQHEQSRSLSTHIARLPRDQREALVLRFYGELRTSEVAEVLGRSEGSVRMLVYRAIGALRDAYRREEGQ